MKVRRHCVDPEDGYLATPDRRGRWDLGVLLGCAVAAALASCGAVDLLRNDPAEPRDRASRFDRFTAELALDMRDTAPLLDRIRWTEQSSNMTGGRWDESRRKTARRTVAWKALQRIDAEFSADKFNDPWAARSRIIEGDLRRALGLSGEDSIDRSANNPPTEGYDSSEASGRAVQRLAATPWSGLVVEAPAVLLAEHANWTVADLAAWENAIAGLADEAQVLGAAPAVLAATENYPYPLFVLDIVLEDMVRLQSSAGSGSPQDPLFGPLFEAASRLPGPDAATFTLPFSKRRRLQREIRVELERLVAALSEIRAQEAQEPFTGSDAPSAKASDAWLKRIQDAAGPEVDAGGLIAVGRAEIQRLQHAVGSLLGLDPESPGIDGLLRERFESLRVREIAPPGSNEPRRAPETIWDNVESHLDAIAAGCPPTLITVRTARVFERPHGRWSPFVRGNLSPINDPLVRPALFLTARERDPTTPAWLREAEAYRYGLPGRAVTDAFRRAARSTVPSYLLQFERETFEEGWGLYAFAFAAENDLLLEQDQGFGRLAQELIAFVGLITDIGLSANRWTIPQAIEYVMESTPLPRSAARDLVARAVSDPGRLGLPAIGLLRFRSLRRGAEALLGDEFDAPEFHAAVLRGGPIPMSEIDARIESWLSERAARADR